MTTRTTTRRPTCSRSSHVLHLVEATATYADFTYLHDADEVDAPVVSMPARTWIDLGTPGTVTVTFEPGDRLNNDEGPA